MMQSLLSIILLLTTATDQRVNASSNVAIAHRVLRIPANHNRKDDNCKKLSESVKRVLNELYEPATFECECSISLGALKAKTRYFVKCKTSNGVCHDKVCAKVQWEANFNSWLKPTTEKACVAYTCKDCKTLDGKNSCYDFQYSGTPVTATSCTATVDDKRCNRCKVCEGYLEGGSHSVVHYMAPDCSNIGGIQTMKYDCGDLASVNEMRETMFMCPKPTKETTKKRWKKTAKSSKSRSSKSSKGSKKDSKRG